MNFKTTEWSFDFVKHRSKYFIASALLLGIGLLFVAIFGLNLGVDFKSGTTLEILVDGQSSGC